MRGLQVSGISKNTRRTVPLPASENGNAKPPPGNAGFRDPAAVRPKPRHFLKPETRRLKPGLAGSQTRAKDARRMIRELSGLKSGPFTRTRREKLPGRRRARPESRERGAARFGENPRRWRAPGGGISDCGFGMSGAIHPVPAPWRFADGGRKIRGSPRSERDSHAPEKSKEPRRQTARLFVPEEGMFNEFNHRHRRHLLRRMGSRVRSRGWRRDPYVFRACLRIRGWRRRGRSRLPGCGL